MKNLIFVFASMIFMHIVDDYYLQGVLAKMKQKKWWKENAPSKMYKHDYIVALIMHGYSWAFMTLLPLVVFCDFKPRKYVIILIVNSILHSFMDDEKANKFNANLLVDQLFHMFQLVFAFAFYVFTK